MGRRGKPVTPGGNDRIDVVTCNGRGENHLGWVRIRRRSGPNIEEASTRRVVSRIVRVDAGYTVPRPSVSGAEIAA